MDYILIRPYGQLDTPIGGCPVRPGFDGFGHFRIVRVCPGLSMFRVGGGRMNSTKRTKRTKCVLVRYDTVCTGDGLLLWIG